MTHAEVIELYKIWAQQVSEPHAHNFYIEGRTMSAYDLVEEIKKGSSVGKRWIRKTLDHFGDREVDLNCFFGEEETSTG